MSGAARLVKAAVVTLVVASLALPAARLFWHATGEDGIVARDLPPPPPPADVAAPDTGALVALAPFGDPTPDAAPEAAPQGGPDLVLQGVILAADPARSAAFVLAGGQGDRFHIGDTILDGVTLTAIAADHVELDVAGQPRVLGFPNAAPSEPEQVAEAAAEAPTDTPADPLDRLRGAIVPGIVRERPAERKPETIQDYVNLWRTRIRANPQQVLDAIGLVSGEGGYTIAADHDSGLARVGLRAGDLVTRVNGQAVGDVERDRELYDQIAASGLAQVEIERNGEVMTMSFPLR